MTFRVFISSVQDEFAEERRQLKEWLTRDLFVSRFVESVFPEIWTPGKLAEGLTIPMLYKTHSSYPVNDLVLKVFDFAGIIESLGTGIKRIIDACRKNGNPPPKFEQNGATFIVTLRKRTVPSGHANDPMDDPINEAIKSNPGIGLVRLAGLTGKGRSTVARAIAALVKDGRVEYRGSKKTGGYYLVEGGVVS